MLTLQFKTPLEIQNQLKPNIDIVYFGGGSSSSVDSFELVEGSVELNWVEYDSNGSQTGTTTRYTEDLTQHSIGDRVDSDYNDGYEVLEWYVNGLCGKDIDHIMIAEDFFNQFDK